MTATATRPTVDTSQPLEPRPVFEQFKRCYTASQVGLLSHVMVEHNRRCIPWRPAPWHYERLAAENGAA